MSGWLYIAGIIAAGVFALYLILAVSALYVAIISSANYLADIKGTLAALHKDTHPDSSQFYLTIQKIARDLHDLQESSRPTLTDIMSPAEVKRIHQTLERIDWNLDRIHDRDDGLQTLKSIDRKMGLITTLDGVHGTLKDMDSALKDMASALKAIGSAMGRGTSLDDVHQTLQNMRTTLERIDEKMGQVTTLDDVHQTIQEVHGVLGDVGTSNVSLAVELQGVHETLHAIADRLDHN
jgi:hypothetical protein